jgi:hypothetical protein
MKFNLNTISLPPTIFSFPIPKVNDRVFNFKEVTALGGTSGDKFPLINGLYLDKT